MAAKRAAKKSPRGEQHFDGIGVAAVLYFRLIRKTSQNICYKMQNNAILNLKYKVCKVKMQSLLCCYT